MVDQGLGKERTLVFSSVFDRLARVTTYLMGKKTLRHFVGAA